MRRFLYTRPKPGGLLARAGLLAALVAVSVGSVIDPGTTAAAGLNDKLQHVLAFALLGLLGFRGYEIEFVPHFPSSSTSHVCLAQVC